MDRFARKFTFTRGLKTKRPEHPQLDDDTREYPSSSLIVYLKRKLKTCEAYSRRLEKRLNHISKIHREDRAALEYERKMRHAAEEQLAMSGVAMIQEAEAKWTALCTEQSTLQNKLSVAESQLQLVPARLEEILREVARVTGSPEQGVFEHFRHFADRSQALLSEPQQIDGSDDMDVDVPPPTPPLAVLQPVPVFHPQPQPQPPPPPQLQPQFEPQLQFQPHLQFQPQPHFQPQPDEKPSYHPQSQLEFRPRSQLQPEPEAQALYHPQPPLEFHPRPQQHHQPEPQAVCLQPNPNAHPDSHPDNSSVPLPTPAPSPQSTRPTFTRPHPQTEDYFSPRAERAPLWSVPGAGDDANFDCARTEDNTSDEEDGEDDDDEEDSDDSDEEDSDDEDEEEDRPIHRPSNTRRVDLSIRMPKQTQPMPPGVGDTSGLPTP